jgi:hypothetical protein
MGGPFPRTSSGIRILLRKGQRELLIRYRFFVHKRIRAAVKRVQFVSDRMSLHTY